MTASLAVACSILLDGLSPISNVSGTGHWTFAAGDPGAVHLWRTIKDAAGRPQVTFTRTSTTIARLRVSVYRVPPGMSELSGHVVLEWTWHGQAYQVSVHRWLSDRQGFVQARAMAAAVVRRLRAGSS